MDVVTKNFRKLVIRSVLAIGAWGFLGVQAHAAFSITARPYDGASDLRFGQVSDAGSPYKSRELIVTVTSDIGKQYEVVQTMIEPLRNEQGTMLPIGAFTVYGIRASNRYGTLLAEQEVPVSNSGRTILYTASSDGLSDSFRLVYVMKDSTRMTPGDYRGRIAYILEPIGSPESPVTVIVNVFAAVDSSGGIEIRTSTGSRVISLSTQRRDRQTADIYVEIKPGTFESFRIVQQFVEPLRSQEGQMLPDDAVYCEVKEARYGTGPSGMAPVSMRQDTVYMANQPGNAETFVVTYGLKDPQKLKAGIYRGNIGYLLQSSAGQTTLGTYPVEIDVAKRFDLIITSESGGAIDFRNVKPQDGPREIYIDIEVQSNTGRRYQVNQQFAYGLGTSDGRMIPEKAFTMKQESLDTKGVLPFANATPVKQGETVLFVSDSEGESDKFRMVYELNPTLDVMAGDYSSRVMYSISEI